MRAEYIQKGASLDFKNETENPIEAGEVVVFGNKIGISGTVILPGRVGTVQMDGVFRFEKKAEEIAAGTTVYFTTSGITANPGVEAVALIEDSLENEVGQSKTGEAVTTGGEICLAAEPGTLPVAGYAVSTAEAASKYVTVKLLG